MNPETPTAPLPHMDDSMDATVLDERGVILRTWVSREQWTTLQTRLTRFRQFSIKLLGVMVVMAGCAFFIPRGHFWDVGPSLILLEAYMAFMLVPQVVCLIVSRRTLRNLRLDELMTLTSDIRTRTPGLMRSLLAWAQSPIPLTNVDETILRQAMDYMEQNAHEFTIAGIGFGVGQRADAITQTLPYTEADAQLIMPWETGASQVLVG